MDNKNLFNISIFNNKSDKIAKTQSLDLKGLFELLSKPDIRNDKDGQLISGATFVENHRSKKNAIESSLLMLDFDHVDIIDLSVWQNMGITFVAYTTFSHATNDKPYAYRVVIPLNKPIPADKYPPLYQWALDITQDKSDRSCKDISRMMYLPSCPAERKKNFQTFSNIGALLDWQNVIKSHDKSDLSPQKPNSTTTTRANTENERDLSAYTNKVIDSEVSNVANALNGCRNDTLNKASFALGQIVAASWANVNECEIEIKLIDASYSNGLINDKGINNVLATIKSGLESGKLSPRSEPENTYSFTNKEKSIPLSPQKKKSISFKDFGLTDKLDELNMRAQEETYILNGLALKGQITAIYAPPNTGKTLIILRLITEQITQKGLSPENIIYINADDTFNGLRKKISIAKDFGFEMLANNEGGFEIKELPNILKEMINDNYCNEIIILDTLKKVVDLMDKKQSSEFMKIARSYVQKGGTIILLGHTNKNKGHDGKHKYAGTSDIVDDCDCAYIASVTTENEATKTISFENIKLRGTNDKEIAFEYSKNNRDYSELLNSVKRINCETFEELKKMGDYILNKPLIMPIIDSLKNGITQKTRIIEHANNFPETSRRKIEDTLDKYTGDLWTYTRNPNVKNSYNYDLTENGKNYQ